MNWLTLGQQRSLGLEQSGVSGKEWLRTVYRLVRVDALNEEANTHSLLDILIAKASREHGLTSERLRNGDDIGTVNHLVDVLAEDGKLGHRRAERARHVRLVV
jgi:hypothetical protein